MIVAGTLWLIMAGTTMPTPLYPIYETQLHFVPFTITLIFTVYAGGVVSALVLAGTWSDQIGRKPILLAAVATSIVSDCLFASGTSLWTLLLARFVSGWSAGLAVATATAAVSELMPFEWRGRSSMTSTCANILGLGSGSVVSGICAVMLPAPLLTPFLVHAGLCCLALGSTAMFVPETAARVRPGRLRVRRISIPREAMPSFIPAATTAFSAFMLIGFVTAVTPGYLAKVFGIRDPVSTGLVVALFFTMAATGQLSLRVLPERMQRLAGEATLAVALSMLVLGLTTGLTLPFLSGITVGGWGVGAAFVAGVATVSRTTSGKGQAEAMATYFTVAYAGVSIPIIGVGIAQSFIGLRQAAVCFAILAIFVLALAKTQTFHLKSRSAMRRPGR